MSMGETAIETGWCVVYKRGDETGAVLINPYGGTAEGHYVIMPWRGVWADAQSAVFKDRTLARRWRDYVRRFRAPDMIKIVRPSAAFALRVLANL